MEIRERAQCKLGAGWQHARSNCLLTYIRREINIAFYDVFAWYLYCSVKDNLRKLSECTDLVIRRDDELYHTNVLKKGRCFG